MAVKRMLSTIRSFLTDNDYRLLNRSPYFDADYYLKLYPDVAKTGIDPILHYMTDGYKEFRQPSKLFDVQYYYETVPELIQREENPLVHFLRTGHKLGLCPHPFFDPKFYEEHYLIGDSLQNPSLQQYLHQGVGDEYYPNRQVYALSQKPVISILVPVYNVKPEHLEKCIQSVYYQSYPHWQLCLADDCSTSREAHPILKKWAALDGRISVVFLSENRGISGATNAAAKFATGDYLTFLDNDDELAIEALFLLVQKINESEADLYYSDEDLIDEEGGRLSVFYKPSYNPQLLLCHNYITHLVAVTKSLFERVGGFDPEKDGAQDYDLFLKLSESAERIVHIPKVLYHWRASSTSTSINHGEKSYADEAGRKALAETLQRRKSGGQVHFTDWKFFYRVQKDLPSCPLVSVVIFCENEENDLGMYCDLVAKTSYQHCEYILLVHTVESAEVFVKEKLKDAENIRIVLWQSDKTCTKNLTEAAGAAAGEFVVFLDGEVSIQNEDWLEALLEHGLNDDVAAVGGRLLTNNEDESYTVPVLSNDSNGYHAAFLLQCSKHMNGLQCAQNVWALPRDLLMVRRSLFLDCGGFDKRYGDTAYADIDLSFRLAEQGGELIYTPFSIGKTHQLQDTGSRLHRSVENEAKSLFQKQWEGKLSQGDPFYNLGILRENDISPEAFREWFSG